jgi:uncharacterized protein (TIGR02246 family)
MLTAISTTTTNDATTADPASIAAPIVQRMEESWNAADGGAFGALFAHEMDFVNVRGEHHRGDGAYIGRAHQGLFDSIYAGSTVRYQLDMARELAPGLILAVASATLEVPHGPMQGVNNARITMVIAAQGDDWRVTAFHNTLVMEGR